MTRKENGLMNDVSTKPAAAFLVLAITATAFYLPFNKAEAASNQAATLGAAQMYQRPAPNFDFNLSRGVAGLRQATGDQLAALNNLKANANSRNATARRNDFGGSPDIIYGFASQPSNGTQEEAGRAFLTENVALFGISNVADLRVFPTRQAPGGYLVRFQQMLQ